MNACTTAYHMTIIQTVNTSDAIGEYFNVSKNDAQCFHYGSAAVITSSWKKKSKVLDPKATIYLELL